MQKKFDEKSYEYVLSKRTDWIRKLIEAWFL